MVAKISVGGQMQLGMGRWLLVTTVLWAMVMSTIGCNRIRTGSLPPTFTNDVVATLEKEEPPLIEPIIILEEEEEKETPLVYELKDEIEFLSEELATMSSENAQKRLPDWSARLAYVQAHTPTLILTSSAAKLNRLSEEQIEKGREVLMCAEAELIYVNAGAKENEVCLKGLEKAKTFDLATPKDIAQLLSATANKLNAATIAKTFENIRTHLSHFNFFITLERTDAAAGELENAKATFNEQTQLLFAESTNDVESGQLEYVTNPVDESSKAVGNMLLEPADDRLAEPPLN